MVEGGGGGVVGGGGARGGIPWGFLSIHLTLFGKPSLL